MSYNLQLIAAKVDVPTMVKAMEEAAIYLGGSSEVFQEEKPAWRASEYNVFSYGEWAVAYKGEVGISPAFLTAISNHLSAEVLAFDTYEVIGYKHISVLNDGVVVALYTYHDGIHHDEGIDWKMEVERLEQLGVRNQILGRRENDKIFSLQYSAEQVLKYRFGFDTEGALTALEGQQSVTLLRFKPGKKRYESLGEDAWKPWSEYLKPT